MVLLALLLLDLITPARDLARKVAGVSGPEVSISMKNLSSLTDPQVRDARRAFEVELAARGAKLSGAGTEVRVTLSESLHHYLWTAEVRERDVVMVSVRKIAGGAEAEASPVRVDRRLLWEQEPPILDAAIAGDLLAVLEPSRVALYRGQQLEATVPLPSRPPVRDDRGRLVVDSAKITVHFAGIACRITLPQTTCVAVGEPWIEEGGTAVAGTNHFRLGSGTLFYTAARANDRLFAGTDGVTRLATGEAIANWGSDIAGIESPCGPLVLATRPVENDDAVQAFRIVAGRPIAAGDAMDFQGPVTALWSSGAGALAVARNTSTGRYAAYALSVACGR
ncbi:MAG: hypothetical protein ACRD8O_22745 [Bryobacteraceae bacterium]